MNPTELLDVLSHGNQLKRTVRTGWAQRGIVAPENVAAHSYGVVFTALVLAELIDESVNLADVLAMAALHDLPESLTSDIPTPAWQFYPREYKKPAEARALAAIAGDSPLRQRFLAWWVALEDDDTVEARLVHDADRLDLYLQAYMYEQQTGNRQLAEFWQHDHTFHFAVAQSVYEELRRRRGPGR